MNKTDKVKEVQRFIDENPGKTKKWYAENNGIITNKTFYDWVKKGFVNTPTSTPTSTPTPTSTSTPSTEEIVEDIFEEYEKDEERKSRRRASDYRRKELESLKCRCDELEAENLELKEKLERYDELKERFNRLQTDYVFEKEMRKKWESLIHDSETNKRKMEDYKEKYEKLQVEYIALKTGESRGTQAVKATEKPKEWWEDIV